MQKIDFKETRYLLAPLAGYTDLPFRSVVKKFGADLTVSEMINADALSRKNERTLKMVQKSPEEVPYSVQIAARNKDVAKSAVEVINEIEWIDGVDLNVGCPVKKAIKAGYGGNLLREYDNLKEILQTIKSTHKKAYFSVKMRIGFDEINALDTAKLIEDSGADFLVVHGRTVKQKYSGEANYEVIRQIKEALSIPVIANGDITSYQKAKEVLEYTKCDGVMIGRGAIGRPWIFLEMKEQKDISPEKKKEIIIEHLTQMYKFYGDKGIILFRKHLHTYAKSLPGASEFRNKVNQFTTYEETLEAVEEFF